MADALDFMRADVAALLDELGTEWTFYVESKTGDPTTGGVTIGTPTTYVVLASPPLSLSPSSGIALLSTTQYAKGSTKEEGAAKIFLSALKADGITSQDFVPVLGMRCAYVGKEYDITKITEYRPSGQIAAWEIRITERI